MLKLNNTFDTGYVFADRYEVVDEIGKGGNSRVYLGLDNSQNPSVEVALKVCTPPAYDKKFIPKFLREAFQLSRLDHPNIVKLIDFGNTEGFYYMATEFIRGRSLKSYVDDGPIVEESAIAVAREMGKAFSHMREHNVIHRDIKPDNILISEDNDIVLVDFGLAKEEGQKTLSVGDELFGTPHFMAPERVLDSENLTIKTDIYSLGVTLFYIVSGKYPFNDKNLVKIVQMHLHQAPPPLKELVQDVSPEFVGVVERMMEKDPKKRCGLDEMIEMLDALPAN
ncbi:MAG: serine/threonine protein kinase [Kiritimatiellaeota bacterium]|nr:serine/threonine protein kinase [Kiritimatiellota bacterium]